MNKSRDFENEILDEFRFQRACEKQSEPEHFCTQKELAENLGMSLRDVRFWLPELVKQGKLGHKRVTHQHKMKDKFWIIDPRMYSSEDIISLYKQYINGQLLQLEFLVDKMKKHPTYPVVRIIAKPWPKLHYYKGKIPKNAKFVQLRRPTFLKSRVNKKGYEYLETFCNGVNQVFTYCDSLSYSQLDDQDMINNLKKHSFEKIMKLIKRSVSGLTELQKHATYQALLQRMPMVNQINQIQKAIELKPF